jgi:hypothetical protein
MAEKKFPVLTTDSVTGKTRPRTPVENAKYKAVDMAQAAKLRKETGIPEPTATKNPAAKVAAKPAAKTAAKPAAKPAVKPAAKKAAPAKKK